uniref:beta-N-acetylhexosaminidase n=1 Tax=Lates calcarifer TaxID=8187 RepID=A0A4W6BTN3_LATCA
EESTMAQRKKLVHLDLKGPPESGIPLIELFSQLGVDGLLLEYEDMFPYEGELRLLQATAQPAYSREEVLSVQELARSKGMEVIPLVQTFVTWRDGTLRGTLNPHREEGVRLVMEMLRQVVELHPGLNTLHIGADEVYMLGEGEESKLWLAAPGRTVEQLFLSHVTKVARAIKEAWPHMTIVMWDDMMRSMSPDTLKASGLVGLVQPMLWDYTPNLTYHSAGMSELWAASSFKGSTSVYTCVPSTQRHVGEPSAVAEGVSASQHILFHMFCFVGARVYDHLSVLCELIPVALPSLAACLQTLLHGQFSAEVQSKVAEKAGSDPRFPGRRLAEVIVELNAVLNTDDIRFFENNMFVRGWFSPYQRQRRTVTPLITMQIHSQASEYLTILQQKVEAVREEMVQLYPDSTVQEWIEEHVIPVMAPLQRITEDITACVKEMVP